MNPPAGIKYKIIKIHLSIEAQYDHHNMILDLIPNLYKDILISLLPFSKAQIHESYSFMPQIYLRQTQVCHKYLWQTQV